jgi:Domain of unknown function (DUF4411)
VPQYLLDANVLIRAHLDYYPVDKVPEYWEWLQHMGQTGVIKIPLEIYEEIKDGPGDEEKDLLFAWLQDDANKNALILQEEAQVAIVQHVVTNGYAPDLTDDQIEEVGRDPFLIAYALAHNPRPCIVTMESSKPGRVRQNRHIPDVCTSLGVDSCTPYKMNRALGFSTSWKAKP